MKNIVEATILTGHFKGEDVMIPRMPMIPTDMPFQFKRLKFPFRLQIQITDSDVETGSAAYIGIRRLRMDQELPTATRGRVQLVYLYNCF
jgi:ATP-dependent DNA helicase PIF1